jgi:hypothetical protein
VDFQDSNLMDYFKAVVFAGDKLREHGSLSDDKLEDITAKIVKEVKENFSLDEYRARDAVDDALSTIKNKKKLSYKTGSISTDMIYLASRMKDGQV